MQALLPISKWSLLLLSIFTVLSGCSNSSSPDLVIYSARKEHLIKPLVEAYQKETGLTVHYFTDKAPVLLEKIKIEGKSCPADIYFTVDAGNLWHAKKQGVLRPTLSRTLSKRLPKHLQDEDNYWFAFSVRARTIVYNKHKVNPSELSTYEDLATKKWKGRLVLRTSKKVYNQSLVAMMIGENGTIKTKGVIKGWINNLAAPVYTSDTKAIQAIANGVGDVGIVNTYYLARLLKKDPSFPVTVFWPNQLTNGTHINISGAGVTRYSAHPKQAVKFLEWLVSKEAQTIFTQLNDEYPVAGDVKLSKEVAAWGKFKSNSASLENAGQFQRQSIRLMDKLGYK
ncbi:Fe(3+) ABC transporter substrate-binding protein [Candidatus Marinamargulisbacteria bacterium SCGC AAA071-K20]|nr:Fe(3+) ABC transporter substrate-binding protein [Candidatus Marinamargulisbacteria bacterium SCGC AAA071-K20]